MTATQMIRLKWSIGQHYGNEEHEEEVKQNDMKWNNKIIPNKL